jgi:CelD/BcsL family acetyltransferase involved in cellulose biosynthesis
VAFIFGLVHGGRYYALKTSFDDRYTEFSPGVVLFTRAIRDSFERGFTRFDFLGEDSLWKHQWATDFEAHSYICVVSGMRPRCAACHLYYARVKPAIKARFPQTASLTKALREQRIENIRKIRSFIGGDRGGE